MPKRWTLTPARRRTLRLALNFAVEWEQTYIDSLRGCTNAESQAARAQSESHLRQFKALQLLLDEPSATS